MNRKHSFIQSAWSLVGAILIALPLAGMAETLMMPDRDALKGEDVVVWGVTTLTGVNYKLECGNLSDTTGPVTDGSYIPLVCNYASGGEFTATLTVDGGAEVATAKVSVFDAAALTADEERGIRVNLAIEDGLRWLWTQQVSRAANFPAGTQTYWGSGWTSSWASLVVLAFENQGYRLSNDDVAPTTIYEKYIVRRGMNYVIDSLVEITLSAQAAGNPCVGVPVDGDECTGLFDRRRDTFHQSYTTGLATLALAGSGAMNRTNTEVGGYTNGKNYKEILQRMANALVFGQIETGRTGRGGWYYNFNGSSSDGSTVGWALLGLLDAEAAGVTVPAFARTEHAFGVNASLNNNGSYDYQSNGNPASLNSVNIEKAGVGLQGLFYTSELAGPRVDAIKQYISDRWTGGSIGGDTGGWVCGAFGNENTGCGYSMFNNFKGLKLHGIQTLPGVGRPAGPGAQPENDWHADYVDWLIANQTNPTTTTGGNWATMRFSAIDRTPFAAIAAIAELILSPVALVLPDPVKFSEVGLMPLTATNPVGTEHTVTAHAEGFCEPEPCDGPPVPGATVVFKVLTGPNAGKTGQGQTDASGDADFTYTDTGGPGTDNIQASIGALGSNVVEKIWQAEGACIEAIKARPKPNKVQVYWTPKDGAASYDITRSETDADNGFATIASDHVTDYATYLDTNVTNLVTYWYRIIPKNQAGDQLCTSDPVEATPPEASSRGRRP